MKASEGETADRITNSRGSITWCIRRTVRSYSRKLFWWQSVFFKKMGGGGGTLLVKELNETKLFMKNIRNMRNG